MSAGGWPLVMVEAAFGSDPGASYLNAAFSMEILPGQYLYVDLTSAMNGASEDFTLNGSEWLEYDVWQVGATVRAAVDLACTDNTTLRDSGAVDQNGLAAHPATDISARANGVWYHRQIKLPSSWAGKTINRVMVADDGNNGGTFTARFRDIMISDGSARGYAIGWTRGQGLPSTFVDRTSNVANSLALTLVRETPVFLDMTEYVLGFGPKRGRPGGKMVESEPSVAEPGTCPLRVDNTGRWFDPLNTASPFNKSGGSGARGDLVPSVLVRIRALWPLNYLANDKLSGPSNTSFESGDLTGWIDESSGGGTLGFTGLIAHDGALSLVGTAINGSQKAKVTSNLYPVRSEREVVVSAAFQKTAGPGNNPASTLAVRCFDSTGALIGTITPSRAVAGLTLPGASFNPPVGSYQLYGGGIWPSDLPTGTEYVSVAITLVDGPPSTTTVALDAVQVTPGSAYSGYLGDGIWYGRFYGRIDDWPVRWSGRRSEVEFTCLDELNVLNQETTPARYYPQALSSARITALLQASAFSGALAIETGLTTVQEYTFEEADSPLGQIQEAVRAEMGLLYADGFGRAVFHARSHRYTAPGSTSDAVFSDSPGASEYLYVAGDPEYGSQMIANFIRTRPAGAITWGTAINAASIRRFGTCSLSREPIVVTLAEATDQSLYLLGRLNAPGFYFSALTIDPTRDDRLWAKVLSYEPGQRITVKRTPRGGGPAINTDYYIESLEDAVDLPFGQSERHWLTTWALSPADEQSYWVLGDPSSSILGTTTKLAF